MHVQHKTPDKIKEQYALKFSGILGAFHAAVLKPKKMYVSSTKATLFHCLKFSMFQNSCCQRLVIFLLRITYIREGHYAGNFEL